MSDGSDSTRHKAFCSGWLEHRVSTGNYSRLWALLEGNVIFIFKTDNPCEETQLGNLTLTKNAEFISKPGGTPSKGYKFELHTSGKENIFRTRKSTERELWRGYILGIAKRSVPADLDLLEQDVKQIRDDVAEYYGDSVSIASTARRPAYRQSINSGRSVESRGLDSGIVSLAGSDGTGSDDRSSHSAQSSSASTLGNGGPTQVHVFYKDRSRNQVPPSWFVPHCSRETAEKLLERSNSLEYGNTLMRESTSFLQNGSYVISTIFVNSNGSITYDHYEVIRTVGGYKMAVQNKHAPMKCLSDVMEYYINTSEYGIRPIITNDLKTLGHDVPGYATEIMNRRPKTVAEPWQWPPGNNNVMEPEPDYDDAESDRLPSDSSTHMDGSNTMSPGILRNRPPTQSGTRKSVGWNSVVNTPPPLPQHHTYAPGSRQNRPAAPTVDEFRQRQRETDELNDFDRMINTFERSSVYNPNAQNGRPRSISQIGVTSPPKPPEAPLPPPPAPHTHNYVNQEHESLAELPVAPPPPRDPIVQSKTPTPTRPSPTSSVSSANRFITPQTSQKPGLKHSASSVTTSGVKHMSANMGHSSSDGQLKQQQHVISPKSPQSLPMWNDTPRKPNNVNSVVNVSNRTSSVVNEQSSEDVKAGVDDQNPGGVATLRQKFANMTSSPATPAVKKGRGRQSLPVLWSLGSQDSQPMEYEIPDEPISKPTNTSYHTNINKYHKSSTTTSAPNVRRYSETQISNTSAGRTSRPTITTGPDDIYDDTAVLVDTMTEPTCYDDTSGLNEDFRKKLGALFSPGPQGPGAGRGVVPKTPTSPRGSNNFNKFESEDHEYQELPEIEPDGVTYVNERYNTETVDNT